MIPGFEYIHHEGRTFEYLGTALPYCHKDLEILGDNVACYEIYDWLPIDAGDTLTVWEKGGIMLIDHMSPCAVYREYIDYDDDRGREYGDVWSLPINTFFGYTATVVGLDVEQVPRFRFNYDVALSNGKAKELITI